jgi:diguanylate cyclase (GGDEF)-like protein
VAATIGERIFTDSCWTAGHVIDMVRTTDVVGRYRGEAFAIYMPNTNADNAFIFAEGYRQMIESLEIQYQAE